MKIKENILEFIKGTRNDTTNESITTESTASKFKQIGAKFNKLNYNDKQLQLQLQLQLDFAFENQYT